MRAQYYAKQITKLIKMVEQGQGDEADTSQLLNASDYLDQARLDREKAMFRRLPLLIAHSSELANVGDFVVRELDSRSWLLVRGDDGVARAFYNYCQHRGRVRITRGLMALRATYWACLERIYFLI